MRLFMENEKIDLYSIVCKYNPNEAILDTGSDTSYRNERKNNYLHNYENTLRALGVNSEYQKELRNKQELVFTRSTSIENTVALFCLSEKDYSQKIEFNNYPVKFIQENMSCIRKCNFLHTNIDFLFSIYNKLLELIKSMNNDEIIVNKIIDTVNLTINISTLKLIYDLKNYVNYNLSYDRLYASDNGILSETDKIEFLKLIKLCITDTFNLAYHMQDYMSGIRQNELYDLPDIGNDDMGLNIFLADNVIIPDKNIISTLSNEKKHLIYEIFNMNSKEYIDMCKGKSDSSKRKYLNEIKTKIEKQLTQECIDNDIIKKLINNIQYKNLSKKNCDEQRYLWEKTTSKKLITEAIQDYQCTIKLYEEYNYNDEDLPDIDGLSPELDVLLEGKACKHEKTHTYENTSTENPYDICIDLHKLLNKFNNGTDIK